MTKVLITKITVLKPFKNNNKNRKKSDHQNKIN